jgi:hypothetical protein
MSKTFYRQLEQCKLRLFLRVQLLKTIVTTSQGNINSFVTKSVPDLSRQPLPASLPTPYHVTMHYIGVLISLWLFLLAAQPKEFIL